jgi:hypothetical protein
VSKLIFHSFLHDNVIFILHALISQVPKAIPDLGRTDHPVKVGMADAYYIDTMIRSG